jgi:hypothetical protein
MVAPRIAKSISQERVDYQTVGARQLPAGGIYSVQRRKIKAPFVPPNPKEFERATSSLASCG